MELRHRDGCLSEAFIDFMSGVRFEPGISQHSGWTASHIIEILTVKISHTIQCMFKLMNFNMFNFRFGCCIQCNRIS